MLATVCVCGGDVRHCFYDNYVRYERYFCYVRNNDIKNKF